MMLMTTATRIWWRWWCL